jgi:hypothetical protein
MPGGEHGRFIKVADMRHCQLWSYFHSPASALTDTAVFRRYASEVARGYARTDEDLGTSFVIRADGSVGCRHGGALGEGAGLGDVVV